MIVEALCGPNAISLRAIGEEFPIQRRDLILRLLFCALVGGIAAPAIAAELRTTILNMASAATASGNPPAVGLIKIIGRELSEPFMTGVKAVKRGRTRRRERSLAYRDHRQVDDRNHDRAVMVAANAAGEAVERAANRIAVRTLDLDRR